MTRAELLIAAARADTYPPRMVANWGTGPLEFLVGPELAEALAAHPEWRPHG